MASLLQRPHSKDSMADHRKQFPRMKTVPRSVKSLMCKWCEINNDCAKFSGAMSTIVELNESGTNEELELEKAKALYQQIHKKGTEFGLEGCWHILKDSPKWHIATLLLEKQEKKATKKKKVILVDIESPDAVGECSSP